MTRLLGIVCLLCLTGCSQQQERGPAAREEALADAIAQGAKLFQRNGCAVCHGDTGKGDGKIAHTLGKPPRDFHDTASYLRGPELAQIEESIRLGVGTGEGSMPGYPHIKPEDRRRIAQFIRSLQRPE